MAAVVVVRGVLMVGWDARRRLLGCLVDGRRAARHVSLLMVYMGVLCPLQRQVGERRRSRGGGACREQP